MLSSDLRVFKAHIQLCLRNFLPHSAIDFSEQHDTLEVIFDDIYVVFIILDATTVLVRFDRTISGERTGSFYDYEMSIEDYGLPGSINILLGVIDDNCVLRWQNNRTNDRGG